MLTGANGAGLSAHRRPPCCWLAPASSEASVRFRCETPQVRQFRHRTPARVWLPGHARCTGRGSVSREVHSTGFSPDRGAFGRAPSLGEEPAVRGGGKRLRRSAPPIPPGPSASAPPIPTRPRSPPGPSAPRAPAPAAPRPPPPPGPRRPPSAPPRPGPPRPGPRRAPAPAAPRPPPRPGPRCAPAPPRPGPRRPPAPPAPRPPRAPAPAAPRPPPPPLGPPRPGPPRPGPRRPTAPAAPRPPPPSAPPRPLHRPGRGATVRRFAGDSRRAPAGNPRPCGPGDKLMRPRACSSGG